MMSKFKKAVFSIIAGLVLVAAIIGMQSAEAVEIRISPTDSPVIFEVTGNFAGSNNDSVVNLSFVDQYADATGLAKRIMDPTVTDRNGIPVELRKFNDSEYVSSVPFRHFKYRIDLSVREPLIAAPHYSWTQKGRIFMKMLDILPDLKSDLYHVTFDFEENISIATVEKQIGPARFEMESIDDGVFLIVPNTSSVSREVRSYSRMSGGTRINLSVMDSWQFSDELVADMAVEIFAEYKKLFGGIPRRTIQINLFKFPGDIGLDRWRAQTQGATISIASTDSTYRNLASQRLHEQLRHELFHLWIPEAVNLDGDYAWFYEGFAQYQSLKAGVWVGRLRFEDFLVSMSEAINNAGLDRSEMPLPELSRLRWQRGPGVVSARGMVVAFLCDLRLLASSNRRDDVGDVSRYLFNNHGRSKTAANAGISIERALLRFPVLNSVLEGQIRKNNPVDWVPVMEPFGIVPAVLNGRIVLDVRPKPTPKQRALLKKLGYNRWKNMPRSR